jgi:hypothetical protein
MLALQKSYMKALGARHSNLRGMPAMQISGQTLNGCKVIERAPQVGKASRWHIIAACGHPATIIGNELRRRHNAGILPYFCLPCALVRNSPKCRPPRTKPKPPPPPREPLCKSCLGIEDNRPVTGCPACGEEHVSLEEQLAFRHQQIREGFGQGGGFSYPNNEFEYKENSGRGKGRPRKVLQRW